MRTKLETFQEPKGAWNYKTLSKLKDHKSVGPFNIILPQCFFVSLTNLIQRVGDRQVSLQGNFIHAMIIIYACIMCILGTGRKFYPGEYTTTSMSFTQPSRGLQHALYYTYYSNVFLFTHIARDKHTVLSSDSLVHRTRWCANTSHLSRPSLFLSSSSLSETMINDSNDTRSHCWPQSVRGSLK